MSTQALKQKGVPEHTVLRSFQEGLYSKTSNRCRRQPKENVHKEFEIKKEVEYLFFLCYAQPTHKFFCLLR